MACFQACGAGRGVADDVRSAAGGVARPSGLGRRGRPCSASRCNCSPPAPGTLSILTVSMRSWPGSRLSSPWRLCSCARSGAPPRFRPCSFCRSWRKSSCAAIDLGRCRCWRRRRRRTRSGPVPYRRVAIFAAAIAWWVGAMACVVRSLEPQSRAARDRQGRRFVGGAVRRQRAGAARAGIPAARFRSPQRQLVGGHLMRSNRSKTARPACRLRKSRSIEKAQPALLQAEIAAPRAATQGRDQRLCARHCRLGGAGRFRQGARRRIGFDRRRAADQGSDASASSITARRSTPFRSRICRISPPPCTPSAMSWTRTRMFSSCS